MYKVLAALCERLEKENIPLQSIEVNKRNINSIRIQFRFDVYEGSHRQYLGWFYDVSSGELLRMVALNQLPVLAEQILNNFKVDIAQKAYLHQGVWVMRTSVGGY